MSIVETIRWHMGAALAIPALAGMMAASPAIAGTSGNDAQFASLFSAWVKMDTGSTAGAGEQDHSSIPSRQPIDDIERISSGFGKRRDPFNHRRRMHQGIDLPAPLGTPVYATADGVVEEAGWVRGYGNLVEINHGDGIETRYGHLSKLIAHANEHVERGQLIGLMGSTGRSTGSHLHYEVRIDGAAVNPLPYIEGTNYELALADARAKRANDAGIVETAMGGPEAKTSTDNENE